jgi:phosphatidylserine/phosphatidylglycerophosphate/cardiolipin synthase-like enzyme
MKTSRPVNEPAVNFINGLLASGKDAAAILDDRHLLIGSHHQKAIIVGVGGKLIAYVGGIEPNRDRLPPPLADELGSPLFDISVQLQDAGAFLVLETFIARWNLHPNKLGATPLRGESVTLPLPAGGPMAIQITHTYGRGFPFSNAVITASTALANGIKNARQFFYMEDQYFVGSEKMRDAIRDALSSNSKPIGIVVIAAEDSVSDLPDVPLRRREFLRPLVNSFPGQFLVFERLGSRSTTGPTAYVHSKLLIVDDEAAFIGSVNSSRRSWFHDSEIGATIVDTNGPGGIAPGTRGVVRDFRCNLWSQHLSLGTALLGDFTFCLGMWQAIISGNPVISGTVSVRPYNVGAIVPRFAIAGVPVNSKLLNIAWNTLEDPT